MRKLSLLVLVVLFLGAFVAAQQPGPGPATITQGAAGITGNGGTGTLGPLYNGSTAAGGPLTNGGGTVGNQGIQLNPATGALPAYTGNVIGVLDYIPNYDVMGAHENGGRGCAGCHAPHNQARGNGGTGAAYGAYADAQGGLWGQDTSAILSSYAAGITFNGGNSAHSGQLYWGTASTGGGTAPSAATAWKDETYTGVATCLSCHDGNVSKGAMMTGVSYEQYFGLLNGIGVGMNAARGGTPFNVQLYGNNPIPTFLGTTATTPNGYASTHPVGQNATANAALGKVLTTASYGLSAAISGDTFTPSAITPNTPYGNFAASYTPAALFKMVNTGTGFANHFVVCTTCHNQHNMAVFTGASDYSVSPPAVAALPAGVTQVRTIFFVNGGYNPGAPYDPTHEPSTMRFCQQCHFSMSSEYFGATNVGTAY